MDNPLLDTSVWSLEGKELKEGEERHRGRHKDQNMGASEFFSHILSHLTKVMPGIFLSFQPL